MFKSRVIPAVGIVIVTFGCLLLSRFTRVLFFTALAVMAAFELRAVLERKGSKLLHWLPIAYTAGQLLLVLLRAEPLWMLVWFALTAFCALLAVILWPALGADAAATTLFILLWPFFFFGIILYVAGADELGLVALILGMLGVWGCDSTALFVGKAFGKHKLSPQISPNKTWEGTLGGAAFSLVAGFALHFVLNFAYLSPGLFECMLVCFVASCFGQVGDLAASLVKRWCGVKDYSNLIGEHGGIMDKMDGMLFALPAAWLLLQALGHHGA